MKITKRKFSDQVEECESKGWRFFEESNWDNHTLVMCKVYGGQCMSSKCKEERGRL